MELVERSITSGDCKDIALLHLKAFPTFFLSSFGEIFLRRFYQSVIANKYGFGVTIKDQDGNLLGFAVGTITTAGFYKKLMKDNFLKLSFAALPKILKKPTVIPRLIKSLKSSGTNNFGNMPCLLSICVDPSVEGKGLGRRLIIAFENKLKDHGFTGSYFLTTDTFDNDYVNTFYKKNAFVLHDSFFQGKRSMNLYTKKID